MNIIQSIMTNNPCYKAGRKISVKGLMLHSVGCAQPSAQVFINQFNKSTYNAACVHAFIDANSGAVYKTLPWNYRGWHGGKGSRGCCNDTHIGIEMCEPKGIKYTNGANFKVIDATEAKAAVKRTYNSAVELFAYLCKEYGLDPMTAIISHNEGRIKGIATAHSDPEHLWNGLGMGYTMDGFRRDVKAKMAGTTNKITEYTDIEAIAWDLNYRGIVTDMQGLINAVKAEPNGRLYWLARKALHYIRQRD